MSELLARFRGPLLFFALTLCCFMTMLADYRALQRRERALPWWSGSLVAMAVPLQQAVATPFESARDAWQNYVALIGVAAENQELRRQIAVLEEERLQYQEALVASGRLQQIAALRDTFEVPMLPAEVVGQDASTWLRSILIDRGRHHGVYSGMPVVTERGLVGLVTATSERAAKTMLLTDRQLAVDGVVQRTRTRGIVRGVGDERLEFKFVPGEAPIQVGDVVITSGLGGVYPKGLRIGEIVEVEEAAADSFLQRVQIRPAAEFNRLEQVFVLLWRGHTMELLYDEGAPSPPAPTGKKAPAS